MVYAVGSWRAENYYQVRCKVAHCPECGTTIAFHDEDTVECYVCGTKLKAERITDRTTGLLRTKAVFVSGQAESPVDKAMELFAELKQLLPRAEYRLTGPIKVPCRPEQEEIIKLVRVLRDNGWEIEQLC